MFFQSSNQSLTSIDNQKQLILKTIKTDDIVKLRQLLKNATYLDLGGNNIGSQKINSLINILLELNCNTLTTLNLYGTGLNNTNVEGIINILLNNQTLSHINLGGNLIKTMEIAQLINALSNHKHLISLELRFSDTKNEAIHALKLFLLNNKSLKSLRLYVNGLEDKDIEQLAEALLYNNTLILLELSANLITTLSAVKLAQALQKNNTLVTIDLAGNDIDEKVLKNIYTLLERNRRNKQLVSSAACKVLPYARYMFYKSSTGTPPTSYIPPELKIYIFHFLNKRDILSGSQLRNIISYAEAADTLGFTKRQFIQSTKCDRLMRQPFLNNKK